MDNEIRWIIRNGECAPNDVNDSMPPMTLITDKHMKKRIQYLVFLLLLGAAACDDPEPIPAYLRIEPFIVDEKGGAGWQKITDGWLYVNNEFLGAYTLPATVPVLAEGESDIVLFPGVKENGIVYTPNIYPFLARYETTVNLSPPGETVIQPRTEYEAAAIIPWEERGDFDGASDLQLINRDGDTTTSYVLTTEGAYAGKSIRMEVDTAHTLIEIATEKVTLPTSAAQEVWLELHHNNDMPFTLILLSITPSSTEFAQAVYLFNDTEDWNKIYINLTEFLVASLQEEHRLVFRASLPKDEKGNYTQPAGKVMIDNILLVHF